MTDIVFEGLRVLLLGLIVVWLWHVGHQQGLAQQPGWRVIWLGFVLIFAGSLLDVTDNFPALDRLVLTGDTPVEAFLEKVVGYLGGTALLAWGFWRWMPRIAALAQMQRQLCGDDDGQCNVPVRASELQIINARLEQEVRRRKQVEWRLQQEKERQLVTLQSIGDGVITTDTNGIIDYINPVGERLTAWENGSAIGRHYLEVLNLVDEATGEALADLVSLCLSQDGAQVHADDGVLTHEDGTEFNINISAAPMRDSHGRVIGAALVLHDLTEVMGIARQLGYQASHDMLTGLVNRREFERLLEGAIRSARSGECQHAMFYIDLDQFKLVNDCCGHRAGDELLVLLSTLLQRHVREADTVARLGGDEFGVLLEDCDLDNALLIAEELRQVVREFRFVWLGKTFEIGASIGVVPIGRSTGRLAEVLSAADTACYVAKDLGRNRIHVYTPDDREVVHHHGEMAWVHRITQAFEDDRLRLYAQPIVPLASEDGVPSHYEVLMRMIGSEGDLIPPMAFIPAAERYNLMPTIDRWVVRTTLGQLRQAQGPHERPPIQCTINLSGQSLGDDHFLDFVIEQFHEADVVPDSICFEITETAAISNLSRAMHFIDVLHGMGCRFALDDFGSGVSSFAYLKNLRVDYLKIDGSFVRDMLRDTVDFAMVESINQIGHVMGLQTIAEFAESGAILEALRTLRVDYAQGHALGTPVPLHDVLAHAVQQRTLQAAEA
ncbi:EAL domain-containing protein [Sulfurivermis fontis]|uniref:EAL domain-containing protein n=1 Tax=Sulfurivermis fontis TaxID=1972068 RepID=UPI001558AFB6|nr:EAL domain-containing protein [Sulfurivermis fontis]